MDLRYAENTPMITRSSFVQAPYAVADHIGTKNGVSCDPDFDCNMSNRKATNQGIELQLAVENSQYFNCLTPDRNLSASPICHRDWSSGALDNTRRFQLCAGAIIPMQPWAPGKEKAQKRRMYRVSHIRGPKRVRKLFGSDKVAAVDDNGNDSPHQTQNDSTVTLPEKERFQDSFKKTRIFSERSNKSQVGKTKNYSNDECSNVHVESADDFKNPSCDTDSHVFLLPTSHLLAFHSHVRNPLLASSEDCSNSRSSAVEVSPARCAHSPTISAIKRRRLPLSKRAKLARMDKQCLRFDRFSEDSNENICEDTSLLSPSISFVKLDLMSPCTEQRYQKKRSRRSLFDSAGSSCDAYFYAIASSSEEPCGNSSQEKIAPMQLNSPFSSLH